MGDEMSARFGTSGTYFTKYDQHFGTNPEFSVLNTSGFNGVFPSIQFKARTYAGIDLGKFSADLYWNYIGDYKTGAAAPSRRSPGTPTAIPMAAAMRWKPRTPSTCTSPTTSPSERRSMT